MVYTAAAAKRVLASESIWHCIRSTGAIHKLVKFSILDATMKSESHAPLHGKPDRSKGHTWEWYRRTLETLRERLMSGRDSQREDTQEPLILDTNDLADTASDEFDHDLAFSLLSQQESALQEIDAALRRIEQGTYGICEETGNPIPEERLRAVPWTRYIKAVQERLEKEA